MVVVSAITFLFGLSVLLALVLALANNKLKVFEDPRIDVVNEMLPGANCGACGVPGCRAFSEKVVGGELAPSGCTVGGADTAAMVAEYLGVDAGAAVKRVARLLCAGGNDVAGQPVVYDGFSSCRAAAAVAGGFKGCTFGCLGLGDCERACDFDAIRMLSDGLPLVEPDKCTACNDCVDECPKGLFTIMPLDANLIVQCKSELAGDELLEICRAACTGCGICALDASPGLISMQKNLPVVDLQKIEQQSEKAVQRCPTGAIVWVNGAQFAKANTGKMSLPV